MSLLYAAFRRTRGAYYLLFVILCGDRSNQSTSVVSSSALSKLLALDLCYARRSIPPHLTKTEI